MFANDDESYGRANTSTRACWSNPTRRACGAIERRPTRAAGLVRLDGDRPRTQPRRAQFRSVPDDGDLTVVTSGLDDGERVVTDGQFGCSAAARERHRAAIDRTRGARK